MCLLSSSSPQGCFLLVANICIFLVFKEVEDILKSDGILHFMCSLLCLLCDPLQCKPAIYWLHKQLEVVILVLWWPVKAQWNKGWGSLWWQPLQYCEECFDSGSLSLWHGCEVVTGIRSRSTKSGSRSLGLWYDQGGSYVPATWYLGWMGHGLMGGIYGSQKFQNWLLGGIITDSDAVVPPRVS